MPEHSLLPRRTPVVWGNRPGPLSDSDIARFRDSGFLLLPQRQRHLDSALFADCVHGCDTLLQSPPQQGVVLERYSREIRTVFNAHGLLACFSRFACQAFLVTAARQILGSDVYLHQSHINYKTALFGEHYFWHQDYAFWANEDGMPGLRALGVALFITEMSPVNGPLIVIPGSHRWLAPKRMGSSARLDNTSGVKLDPDDLSAHGLLTPDELVAMSLAARPEAVLGPEASLLLFDPNIAHASADNLSLGARIMALFFYNSVENTLVNPARPEFIASRDYRPL